MRIVLTTGFLIRNYILLEVWGGSYTDTLGPLHRNVIPLIPPKENLIRQCPQCKCPIPVAVSGELLLATVVFLNYMGDSFVILA